MKLTSKIILTACSKNVIPRVNEYLNGLLALALTKQRLKFHTEVCNYTEPVTNVTIYEDTFIIDIPEACDMVDLIHYIDTLAEAYGQDYWLLVDDEGRAYKQYPGQLQGEPMGYFKEVNPWNVGHECKSYKNCTRLLGHEYIIETEEEVKSKAFTAAERIELDASKARSYNFGPHAVPV